MKRIEVIPSWSKSLKYISHITQIQSNGKNGQVEARGPKTTTKSQLSETIYIMPGLLAEWIRAYKVQAIEAFWVGNSKTTGNLVIKLRNQLYEIRRCVLDFSPELVSIDNKKVVGTADIITKGGQMIDYKSSVTLKLGKPRTVAADTNLLLLL